MSDFEVLEIRELSPRSHALQYTTPFIQSQCTSGDLCGSDFVSLGCYASPDYSTCYYDSAQGYSVCTVCICYGMDSGENGCDTNAPGTSTSVAHPSLYVGSSNKKHAVSFKMVIGLFLVCVWLNVFGIVLYL